MKNRPTWRTIALGVLVTLVVLGTGWALEKAYSNAHTRGGALSEPAKPSDAATTPGSREPLDVQPAARDSIQEYDRSDLILIQG